MLRLKICERMSKAAPAWVGVKDPRFGEGAFRAAVRRFRRSGGVWLQR